MKLKIVAKDLLQNASGLQWTPDGKHLIVGCNDSFVRLFDTQTGNEIKKVKLQDDVVRNVLVDPSGKEILYCNSKDGNFKLAKLETGELLHRFIGHEKLVTTINTDKLWKRLASCDRDRLVIIWDLESKKEIKRLSGFAGELRCAIWSPQENYFLTAGFDKKITIFDAENFVELKVMKCQSLIYTVKWSLDSQSVFAALDDSTIVMWDFETASEIKKFKGHESGIPSLILCGSGKYLASTSADNTIRIWDIYKGAEIAKLVGHEGTTSGLVLSPDIKSLACRSFDNSVSIWRLDFERKIKDCVGHTGLISCFAWSNDGKMLASGASDNKVIIWDAENCKQIKQLNMLGTAWCVEWSPDGAKLATGGLDKSINIWEVATGNVVQKQECKDSIMSEAWSPDGKKLAAGSYDKFVRILEIETNNIGDMIKESEGVVTAMSWNFESKLLAYVITKNLIVWEVATKERKVFRGHLENVKSFSWSPSCKNLISCSDDKTIRIWEYESCQEVHKLIGHTDSVLSVFWSLDGNNIISSSCDKTIKIWDTSTSDVIREIHTAFDDSDTLAVSFEGKIALNASTSIKIFNLMDIWRNFEDYNLFYLSFNIFPKLSYLEDTYRATVELLVDYRFGGYTTIFHLLLENNYYFQLEMLVNFCNKYAIFPKSFPADIEGKSIFYHLFKENSQISKPLTILLIQYVIASQVKFGLISLDSEALFKILEISSADFLGLINSRFFEFDESPGEVIWLDSKKEYSPNLFLGFNFLRKNNVFNDKSKFSDVVFLRDDQKIIRNNQKITPFVKVCDIPVEYFSLKIFSKILESSNLNDFFQNYVILSILNLKWKLFGRKRFLLDNVLYFLFLIIITINSLIFLPRFILNSDDTTNSILFLTFSTLVGILSLILAKNELNDFDSNYFKSFWNWIDFLIIIMNICCTIFDYLLVTNSFEGLDYLRIFHSIDFFLCWLRIFEVFRAFRQTAYLIEIIQQVILDMKIFVFLVLLFLLNCSFSG